MSLIFWALCVSVVAATEISDHPHVQTDKGTLRGIYDTSRNGVQYETYLGIRYAQVSRRFDVSVPTGSWEGIKNATAHCSHCAQQSLFGSPSTGEEDCLYLNVFTPKADTQKRAVLVFIHGGGFNMGASTEYGGNYLVDEDLVLVTINYRLGILGFLNTPRGPIGGNMGLKDQVLALKWVQENIEYFGGDKDGVTVSGQSAGAASALHLMTSPAVQGLFRGIFAMSGSMLSPFAFKRSNMREAKEVGEYLNCGDTKDQAALVACLEAEPLETLMLAQKSIQKWNLDFLKFFPTRGKSSPLNPTPFLDVSPLKRLLKKDFRKVPVLLTMTKDEGGFPRGILLMRNGDLLNDFNDNYNRIAPHVFLLDEEFGREAKQVGKAIKEHYFGNTRVTNDTEEYLIKAFSDVYYTRSVAKTAYLLTESNVPVYTGLFTHSRKDFSPVMLFGIDEQIDGVFHCEDLAYIFNPTGVSNPIPALAPFKDPKDVEFSKKYVKMIASFVKTGVPEVTFEGNANWPQVSLDEVYSKTLNWFKMDDNGYLLLDLYGFRLHFWRTIEKKMKPKKEKKDRTEL